MTLQRLLINHLNRGQAAVGKTPFSLLLSLVSGPDYTAADWRSIAIETYPREKLATVNDRDAMHAFSLKVAAGAMEVGKTNDLQIVDCYFSVSNSQLSEGHLIKYARIYTTVRNKRLLSFAFSANSLEYFNKIAASIMTVKSSATS